MGKRIDNKLKIRSDFKLSCISVFLFGLISQGMGLFNKYSNHDDLHYFFTGGETFTSGRWMLYLAERIEKLINGDGLFSLSVFNGFFTLICIAIVLCLIIDLFEIRTPAFIIFLGGIFVSIPVITCMFGYMFIAHFFGLSLLMAVFGAYIVLKYDTWYITLSGVVLMTLSTGIYQGFIPTILCLLLFGLIIKFYDAEDRAQLNAAFKKTIVVILSITSFLLSYICLTYFINNLLEIQLSAYKGMNSVSDVPLSEYIGRVIFAYKEFFILPNDYQSIYYDVNLRPGIVEPLYGFLLSVFFILYGKLVYTRRNNMAAAFALVFLMLFIPAAVNFIFIMTNPAVCYAMMVYGKALFFVLFFRVMETSLQNMESFASKAVKYSTGAAAALIIFVFCRFDNVCYLRMDLIQSQAIRYFTTLVTRIQSTGGYDSYHYVSYINSPDPGYKDNSVEEFTEFKQIRIPPYYDFYHSVSDSIWREYLRIWCGFSPHEIDQKYFENLPEVQTMPHYPNEGSIKIIDDIVVINF